MKIPETITVSEVHPNSIIMGSHHESRRVSWGSWSCSCLQVPDSWDLSGTSPECHMSSAGWTWLHHFFGSVTFVGFFWITGWLGVASFSNVKFLTTSPPVQPALVLSRLFCCLDWWNDSVVVLLHSFEHAGLHTSAAHCMPINWTTGKKGWHRRMDSQDYPPHLKIASDLKSSNRRNIQSKFYLSSVTSLDVIAFQILWRKTMNYSLKSSSSCISSGKYLFEVKINCLLAPYLSKFSTLTFSYDSTWTFQYIHVVGNFFLNFLYSKLLPPNQDTSIPLAVITMPQ